MRLINTETLEFAEFFDDNIPEYAILSHRWAHDEVTYDEYLAGRTKESDGYRKIQKLCELARQGIRIQAYTSDGAVEYCDEQRFKWAWIDTCCIDKRSSSELSEAINSMYQWYEQAAVCLVFLPDVEPAQQVSERLAGSHAGLSVLEDDMVQEEDFASFSRKQFSDSVWFTRGWTLQELVASMLLAFYNTRFELIGWKTSPLLLELIYSTTNITTYVLQHGLILNIYSKKYNSIAERFSWASRRSTARGEDEAYCLLGICGVSMPLLYGEGSYRAFQRLQLEIIGQSIDPTILAWSGGVDSRSILASCPANFSNPQFHDVRYKHSAMRLYTRTQRGIEFDASISRAVPRSLELISDHRLMDRLMGYYYFLPILRHGSGRETFLVLLMRDRDPDGAIRSWREGVATIETDSKSIAWLRSFENRPVDSLWTSNTFKRTTPIELDGRPMPDKEFRRSRTFRAWGCSLLPRKRVRMYVPL